ncbi:MAG: hypothetical protein ACOYLS_04605 [Polymorphobacter sp.]
MTDGTTVAHASHRVEVATALLLSIAGLISAWSSYQASLWGGIQASHYSRASAKVTEASRLEIVDGQLVAADSMMFFAWFEAAAVNDEARMAFFERRFTPQLRAIFDPWRARFPGDVRRYSVDPDAPHALPRSQHSTGTEGRALRRAADAEFVEGDEANRIGDRYVATTVVLSTVLFLGGISPLLKIPLYRITLLALAAVLGIAAGLFIASLPIARL